MIPGESTQFRQLGSGNETLSSKSCDPGRCGVDEFATTVQYNVETYDIKTVLADEINKIILTLPTSIRFSWIEESDLLTPIQFQSVG